MTLPVLQKLNCLAPLGEAEQIAVAGLVHQRRSVVAGTDLANEGRPWPGVLVLHEGWAVRYRLLPDGRRQIINFLIPGDLVALDIAVIGIADHSVGTITPVSLSTISAEDMAALRRLSPPLDRALDWAAAQESAILREHIVNVGRRSAYERVSHLLLELRARLEPIGRVEEGRYDLPLSQTILADALGLSVVHINRTLKRLHADQLIRIDQRTIAIMNLPALVEIADFKPLYLHLPRPLISQRAAGAG